MTLLLIILIVLLFAGFPAYPYSRNWGWGPSGLIFVILLILLIWIVIGGRP